MKIPEGASSSIAILKLVLDDLQKSHQLSAEETIRIALGAAGEEPTLPVSIFVQEITILEGVVKYLHERNSQTFTSIARTLNRDPRSTWGSYRRATKKYSGHLPEDPSSLRIPISLFSRNELSAGEALITHLKDVCKLRYADIARLIHRDPRTVWALYQSGARKKRKEARR